jgi:hypothetical protein
MNKGNKYLETEYEIFFTKLFPEKNNPYSKEVYADLNAGMLPDIFPCRLHAT